MFGHHNTDDGGTYGYWGIEDPLAGKALMALKHAWQ